MKKILERIVAAVVALVMVVSLFATTGLTVQAQDLRRDEEPNELHNPANADGEFIGYSYIWFGSYPHSEIIAERQVNTINQCLGDVEEGECWIDGYKYSKVKKPSDDYATNWTNDTNNNYRYFKWERIRWRILNIDKDNNKMFVMADECLLPRLFHGMDYPFYTTHPFWEDSDMRSWLNGYDSQCNSLNNNYTVKGSNFLTTAFSDIEISDILVTSVVNHGQSRDWNTWINDQNLSNTDDRLFLLSYKEITNPLYGFDEDPNANCINRGVSYTSYARALGTDVNESNGIKYGSYWLRSQDGGYNESKYAVTGGFRVCSYDMRDAPFFYGISVVPAMNLRLDSTLYLLENDGKSGFCGEVPVKVEYELDGGTNDPKNPQYYIRSAGISSFADPYKAGYTFEGWYEDAGLFKKITEIPANKEKITRFTPSGVKTITT